MCKRMMMVTLSIVAGLGLTLMMGGCGSSNSAGADRSYSASSAPSESATAGLVYREHGDDWESPRESLGGTLGSATSNSVAKLFERQRASSGFLADDVDNDLDQAQLYDLALDDLLSQKLSDKHTETPETEYLIIQRRKNLEKSRDILGSGGMVGRAADSDEVYAFPLTHTDAKALIHGYIATVDVTQKFRNPYDVKIEAEYVFPLPQTAAVRDFVMVIGTRRIRGIVREREEAERIYAAARASGHTASLLTQERPNIFTQRVANIEPGKAVDVSIRYFHALPFKDGGYEFVYPMIVGPRFNPPGSAHGIGAVSSSGQGRSGQPTEVAYLRDSERSGHDIALEVTIAAGAEIDLAQCETHRVHQRKDAKGNVVVTLDASDRIPNKDFVLTYRTRGDQLRSTLAIQEGRDGGHFTLMLNPPVSAPTGVERPLEMIFVVDCSGSMKGRPMEQVHEALEESINLLRPQDTFQIITFSNTASAFGSRPVSANFENSRKARIFARGLGAGGGTMMMRGIEAALAFPHDPERLRFVCFMTDGFIGNDDEILSKIGRDLGETRIFSFGVGSAPNRYLMERMATLGRGASAYLSAEENGKDVMSRFFARVRHPALADVRLDFRGADVRDVFPKVIPDLYVGRPVIITGRYRGAPPSAVSVAGRSDGAAVRFEANTDTVAAAGTASLDAVWARLKIADLKNASLRSHDTSGELRQEILATALEHGLLSQFTAFVAVDASSSTDGGPPERVVPVAVPVPAGTSFESTVSGK